MIEAEILLSKRLIERSISHTEISLANRELKRPRKPGENTVFLRIGFRFRRIGSDGWLRRIGKSVQRRVFPGQSATMSSPCGQKRAG